MLVWRNGRRTGLKIPRWQHRVGSTPTTSTTSPGAWRPAMLRAFFISKFGHCQLFFCDKTIRSRTHWVRRGTRKIVQIFWVGLPPPAPEKKRRFCLGNTSGVPSAVALVFSLSRQSQMFVMGHP